MDPLQRCPYFDDATRTNHWAHDASHSPNSLPDQVRIPVTAKQNYGDLIAQLEGVILGGADSVALTPSATDTARVWRQPRN